MSDEQSAPVEPEVLPQPSSDAEVGRWPDAGDTEADGNAGFATSAGGSVPDGGSADTDEADETDAQAAHGVRAEQTQAQAEPELPVEPEPEPLAVISSADGEGSQQPVISAPQEQNSQQAVISAAETAESQQIGQEPGFAPPSEPGFPASAANAPDQTAGIAQPQQPTGVPGWGTGPAAWGVAPVPKPRSKALLGTGIGLGYAALAAASAFAVIAIASPGPVTVSGLAGATSPVGTSSPVSPPAAPSPSPAASSAAPSTAPPTTATPTSTVTGQVDGGVHTGDLRFFLLPPPQGPSSVQGDPDGTTESLSDVVSEYGGGSTVRSTLNSLDFKAACYRTYQDSNLGANVSIELIQFGGSSDSSAWLSGFSYSGKGIKSISVPGEPDAEGWSQDNDGTYQVTGVYRDGDTFFDVAVFGSQPVSASDLGQVMRAEHARLADG